MTISAVILTKNEEKNIEACIKSVSFCNEVIVIDDGSTDETRAIAEKNKAKVFEHALENNFARQRNFGLSKAKGEWVLFLDADERVSEGLAFEIMESLHRPGQEYNGYFLKRLDVMWGKQLNFGETGNMHLLRLAKKDAGQWSDTVHEVWHVKGKTGVLKNPIMHYPHPSVTEFLKEINYYTTLRAQELFDSGTRASWFSVLAYPKAKIFTNFILKQGFRDGVVGLIVAVMMSFHSFLVRGKLWQLSEQK